MVFGHNKLYPLTSPQIRPCGTLPAPTRGAHCPVCIVNSITVLFIALIVSFVRKQRIFHSLYTIIDTFCCKQQSRINYRLHSRIFKTYLITLSPWYAYFDHFGLSDKTQMSTKIQCSPPLLLSFTQLQSHSDVNNILRLTTVVTYIPINIIVVCISSWQVFIYHLVSTTKHPC